MERKQVMDLLREAKSASARLDLPRVAEIQIQLCESRARGVRSLQVESALTDWLDGRLPDGPEKICKLMGC